MVIESDLALLRRMATVNISMGDVIRQMLERMEDGVLPAADLRSVGRELALLGTDMVRRADELDRTGVVDSDDAT